MALLIAEMVPLAPGLILALCVLAGVGTVMAMPSRREASIRKAGGIVLILAGAILSAMLVRFTAGAADGGMGFYFWVFSAIALVGAMRVITHSKPVYSALYFVLTVFATAGLFLLLWAEFMAAALILIYAGAILITYVFVIMLAAEATPKGMEGAAEAVLEHDAVAREPVMVSAVGFAMLGVILFVIFDKMNVDGRNAITVGAQKPVISQVVTGQTQELGSFLFNSQMINLELAGLLLTIAMVGAIVIARRKLTSESVEAKTLEQGGEVVIGPATPVDDNPHSIPVLGTKNPRQKAYPQT